MIKKRYKTIKRIILTGTWDDDDKMMDYLQRNNYCYVTHNFSDLPKVKVIGEK